MAALYHYCSNASFISIIKNHTFQASEFTLSNDLLEGKWIREIVKACCDEKSGKQLNPYQQSILFERLDGLISVLGAFGICLSEEGDLLSQWRAYSENGYGVSIGFDESCFGVEGSPLPSLQKIIYDPAFQKQQIQNDLDRIFELLGKGAGTRPTLLSQAGMSEDEREEDDRQRKQLDNELTTAIFGLFPHLYVFKNPAFREEREWRSVTIVIPPEQKRRQSQGPGLFLHELDFRAVSDRIVPYREFSLDTNLGRCVITDVVLGPRNVTPPRVVEAALLRYGWKGVHVRKSTASYR
jgi:hypothetical protein